MEQARYVRLNAEAIEEFANRLERSFNPISWHNEVHFFDGTEKTVSWIFVLDTLNFCFWPDPGRPAWTVEYGGRKYSGYMALAASLKRALEESVPITEPEFLAEIDRQTVERIFRGEGVMPLLSERVENLRELGTILIERWKGSAMSIIEEARHSSASFVRLVVDTFSSFRDQADYEGRTVYFWKRAQILASDLFHAFQGKGPGFFEDIHVLTACADYKLPQVLRCLGIIQYSEDLERRINSLEYLKPGSPEEVEIRAATVEAVERIRESLAGRGFFVTSLAIDHHLWELGQKDDFRRNPYHRCRTIFY